MAGLIGIELLRWRLADRTGLALALALLAALANELARGLRSDWCEAWWLGTHVTTSEVYTSQLADLGRSALEPLALVLLAASAALMAWAPRHLQRVPSPQPVPVP